MRGRPRTLSSLAAAAVGAAVLSVQGPAALAMSAPPTPTATAPVVRTLEGVARVWRASAPASLLVGRSVQGRPIVAVRQGRADAPYVVLVLGQMHGSEPRGRDVVAAIRRLAPPAQVQVWTISTMNPDGAARGSRTDARGVDLNRNFPYSWSPAWSSRSFYPGPAPASEPETRAVMGFLDRLRPDLIVSLHQHFTAVDLGAGKARIWSQRLSAALHLPLASVPCGTGTCHGTLVQWYDASHAGSAVTVELPLLVPASLAASYARAILTVAARLVPAR